MHVVRMQHGKVNALDLELLLAVREAGPATADLVLTARTMTPEQARAVGLVDEVVTPTT